MKKLIIPFLLLAVVSCSSIKTSFDYDKQVDFTNYKTYNYPKDDVLPNVGQLDRDRIIKAAEAELALKGFKKSDTPDVLVDINIKTKETMTATATTSGDYGGYRGRYGYGGGFSTTQIDYDQYTEGTLIFTMIDKSTEQIVWQGTGTQTLDENANTDKKEANINYSMKQILKNYPPEN